MSTGLKDKKILLGVCGSIAAYKSLFLTRLLTKAGAQVKVVMTPAAASFVQPISFSVLSGNECLVDYVRKDNDTWNNHVEMGLWADIMLIAPASASTLSKMAHGHCDNLLIGTYLSARCPVAIAPAMDEDMWYHGSTQRNIQILREYGNHIIPVGTGSLASGLIGPGRMAEPEDIISYLENFFQPRNTKLQGKNILISAGPTYEHLDPVRFIGNHSSGKMGIAIADAAAQRGAEVHLVLGPTDLKAQSDQVQTQKVVSATDMQSAMSEHYETADIVIFAAAVADYAPAQVSDIKIKKQDEEMTLVLRKNPDIAFNFGKIKRKDQISVGFALETNNEVENAEQKLKKKHFDLIVLNSLQDSGAGFRHQTNKITILDNEGHVFPFELKSKDAVANDILDVIESKL